MIITPPPNLVNTSINGQSSSAILNSMVFRIDQLRTPGVTLASTDVARYGIGTTQKQVYGAQMNEIGFSILSDGYGDTWQFWHNWLKSIFQFTGEASAGTSTNASNRIASYTSEYKDNYSTVAEIQIYDMNGDKQITIDMYDAFPTTMREVSLGWGDNGSLLKLSISMAYKEYTINGSAITPLPAVLQAAVLQSPSPSQLA